MNLFCNFKYELIADDTRRSALSRFAGCRRAVFNKALELQNDHKANRDFARIIFSGNSPRSTPPRRGFSYATASSSQ